MFNRFIRYLGKIKGTADNGSNLIMADGKTLTVTDDASVPADVATTGAAGLMSAADKTKSDAYETIYNEDFTGQASLSVSYDAGKYRRLFVSLHTGSGNAAAPTLKLDGINHTGVIFGTAAYLSNGGSTGAGSGTWAQRDQWADNLINLIKVGQNGSAEIDIVFAADSSTVDWHGTGNGQLTIVGSAATGQPLSGLTSTGITIAFGGNTNGHLEVIGYK